MGFWLSGVGTIGHSRGGSSAGSVGVFPTVNGKNVLGEINFNSYDCYGFALLGELLESLTSPSRRRCAQNRNPDRARLVWNREVPFIR